MRNERIDVHEFIEVQSNHYKKVWDMGVRDLSFPIYPREYMTWQGKRVVHCEFSNDIILFEKCEYCENKNLDKNDCCTTCSAPAEM